MANKSGYYKYLRQKKLEESSRKSFPENYPSKTKLVLVTIIGIAASCIATACFLLLFL